jgi:hypothetical protein
MMNWKGFGRKFSWSNFKVLFRNLPGGTVENHEKVSVRVAGIRLRFEAGTPNTK